MKLSEAVIQGSRDKIQGTRVLCADDDTVCALGAVGIACGFSTFQLIAKEKSYPDLRKKFTQLNDIVDYPPNNKNYKKGDLVEVIYYCNDTKRWSFKKIAAWLKSKGY